MPLQKYSIKHNGKELDTHISESESVAKKWVHQDYPYIPVQEMTASIVDDVPVKGGTESGTAPGQSGPKPDSAPVEGGSKPSRKPLTEEEAAKKARDLVLNNPKRKPRADKGQKRVKADKPKRRTVYYLSAGAVQTFDSKDKLEQALATLEDVSCFTVIDGGSIRVIQKRFALVQPEK